jgi:hypothetical protein
MLRGGESKQLGRGISSFSAVPRQPLKFGQHKVPLTGFDAFVETAMASSFERDLTIRVGLFGNPVILTARNFTIWACCEEHQKDTSLQKPIIGRPFRILLV